MIFLRIGNFVFSIFLSFIIVSGFIIYSIYLINTIQNSIIIYNGTCCKNGNSNFTDQCLITNSSFCYINNGIFLNITDCNVCIPDPSTVCPPSFGNATKYSILVGDGN